MRPQSNTKTQDSGNILRWIKWMFKLWIRFKWEIKNIRDNVVLDGWDLVNIDIEKARPRNNFLMHIYIPFSEYLIKVTSAPVFVVNNKHKIIILKFLYFLNFNISLKFTFFRHTTLIHHVNIWIYVIQPNFFGKKMSQFSFFMFLI